MTNQKDMTEKSGKLYWRSLESLAETKEFREKLRNEFPAGAAELEFSSALDRRKFLGLMGASMALAGVTGCVRKPYEKILPYSKRPEDLIPGRPMFYSTAMHVAGTVLGVLVESHEGRPTKIEGNPAHPMSMGATNPWAQAEILNLYDPDRSRRPYNAGKEVNWESFTTFASSHFSGLKNKGGNGLALVVEPLPSPTYLQLIQDFQKAFPQARVYQTWSASGATRSAAQRSLGLAGASPLYQLDKADIVASFDADFLGTEGDMVRNARLFSKKRRVESDQDGMNRLYVVEAAYTITGLMADHRARIRTSQVGETLLALASALVTQGVSFPPPFDARLSGRKAPEGTEKWVSVLAADLVAARGRSLVIVGEKQPAWVHAIGMAINSALGNIGEPLQFVADPHFVEMGSFEDLVAALQGKQIDTLVMLGGNPVYDSPGDVGFGNLLKEIPTSIHLSQVFDETSQVSTWHLPQSHSLETWGDLRASDGTVTIVQPLIAPIFESLSSIELLARLIGGIPDRGYELVRTYWSNRRGGSDFEKRWKLWLHDGVIAEVKEAPLSVAGNWAQAAELLSAAAPASDVSAQLLELVFVLDPTVYDGRYANNGWLQELPDPVSKLTWDNAALIGPKTARDLGLKSEDMIELVVDGKTQKIAVFEVPGIADYTAILPLGYGRTFGGKIATGAGFDVNRLRSLRAPHFVAGAQVKKLGESYRLATTQTYGLMRGPSEDKDRPIVREATLAEFRQNPAFVEKLELLPKEQHKTFLWIPPNQEAGQQWGMSIDLNVCIGCNACTVACQAENNIMVVGKEQVLNGREMHWIRIDRYFTGTVDDPEVVVQPMACVQCENAPCESVCPVAATAHSPDGLNDMAYNRCIGTRFCANNCPYKVRRFNFFNFSRLNSEVNPLLGMAQNPNVTVRFRGVMEKCTYCVQRIRDAQIQAKTTGTGDGNVADGQVITACAQVCPTEAIVFGDVNNTESKVSRMKRQSRNYAVLGELNTQPRTTYLAKLRNPNPELV